MTCSNTSRSNSSSSSPITTTHIPSTRSNRSFPTHRSCRCKPCSTVLCPTSCLSSTQRLTAVVRVTANRTSSCRKSFHCVALGALHGAPCDFASVVNRRKGQSFVIESSNELFSYRLCLLCISVSKSRLLRPVDVSIPSH